MNTRLLTMPIVGVLVLAMPALAQEKPGANDRPVDQLVRELRDPDAGARAQSAAALRRQAARAKEAAPALAAALKDDESAVGGWAAVALWHINRQAEPVLPSLLTARHAADEAPRNEVAEAI